jgi:hypothetical protein
MQKKTLIAVFISVLAVLCWISLQCVFIFGFKAIEKVLESTATERIVFVRSSKLESKPGIRVLDANNSFFQIKIIEPNRIDVNWGNTSIYLKNRCRVATLKKEKRVQVIGTLPDNKQYPITIDSGFDQYMLVSDTIVLDAGLEIYPAAELGGINGGFCHLGRLRIGELTIEHPLCVYTLAHYEGRLLGRTKWKDKTILFGLNLMKQFRYILIDNINHKVEFSTQDTFEPADPNVWSRYPTILEKDDSSLERLMVDIPLAGKTRHLMFDTGSGCGLIVAKDVWKTISPKLTIHKKTTDKLRMMHGFEPSEKITVQNLDVGNSRLNNAYIYMLLNEEPCGSDFFLLGMGFFKDTVVVIDFEHNLLWIKNQQQSVIYKDDKPAEI